MNDQDIQFFTRKARQFCDAQDRSLEEVKVRLKSWSCPHDWIAIIMKDLEKEEFIDEQRFANNFARGKFRIKSWGKLKIMIALFQHKIPQTMIKKALDEIDEKEYRDTLADVLEKKWRITSGEHYTKLNKTAAYAVGKGYEASLVFEMLKGKE